MGVDLLTPWFLAGLLAVGVPIAIHLIHRRQTRTLPIATLRFLRKIPARTIRRRRLEEYILLALRMLLLALLALAGTRPVLRDAAAAGGATSVAIVLDDSWSMDYRVAGVTRFQEARQSALAVLRSLEEGDRAALIRASAPAGSALGRDLAGLRRRIGSARVSPLAPNLLSAVRAGLALLREAREPNRELVVVTDLQARAVSPLLEDLRDEPGDDEIRVLVLDVGAEVPSNRGITKVTAGDGAVVAGETVPVTVEVRNYSTASATTRASLVIGEERVGEATLDLGPGETVTATLPASLDVPGAEAGRVYLDGDDLLTDDVRWFALPVAGRIPVLLVNGDPSPIAFQDEAFFLRAALSPEDLGARGVTSPVSLKTVPVEELGRQDLDTYRVVIFANVPKLTPREATAIRAFVLTGGGLLFFTGNRVRPDEMNRALGTDPDEGLLPVVLTAPGQLGEGPESSLPLTEVDEAHPLFKGLPERAFADLRKIHARRANGADAKAAGGRVVARLTQGTPFLVEKEPRRGRVLFVNTSADTGWGNLPIRTLFLPLLHRAVRRLAGAADDNRERILGESIRIPPPPPAAPPVEVTDPTGEIGRPVAEEGGPGEVLYGPLVRPGVYRVKGSGLGDVWLFAANPDPEESDLSRASPDSLEDRFGADRLTYLRAGEGLPAELGHSRHGRPIWGYLLLVALACFLFEAFFANRIAGARSADTDPEGGEEEG